MIKVKITTPNPLIPLKRQTPGKKGVWGNCEFLMDQPVESCDFWFVMDGLQKPETTKVPRSNVILITSESEDMKRYDQKYLDQFGAILTSQRNMKHPHLILTAQGQSWMIGHMGGRSGVDPKDYDKHFIPYDELKAITSIKKDRLLSVFSSIKSRTPGQELRLNFVEALKKHFGDRIHVYGVHERYVHDKWDGIAPYKYHISLENSHRNDYWTEKLADAFLAGAYPLYFGAPNIYDYFPKDSLTTLDLADFDKAIATIEEAIHNDYYEKRKKNIWEARDLVLDKHNVFAIMARVVESMQTGGKPESVTIAPENKKKTLAQKVAEKLRNVPGVYKLARWGYRTIRKKYDKR